MRKNLLIFPILMLAAVTIGGTIYKWVDENGVTHYSEIPPLGTKTQGVKIDPAPPKEEIEKAQQKSQELREELHRKSVEQEIEAAKRQKECDHLRAILIQLNLPGPYSVPMEGGKVLVVPQETKPVFRQVFEKEISEKCR